VSYVYLCYGIHQMFNIVTGIAGDGQAVLIRAIAPYLGLPDHPSTGRGPGKVTQALGLDRRHDRRDLAHGDLFVAAAALVRTPRRARRAAGGGAPAAAAGGPAARWCWGGAPPGGGPAPRRPGPRRDRPARSPLARRAGGDGRPQRVDAAQPLAVQHLAEPLAV